MKKVAKIILVVLVLVSLSPWQSYGEMMNIPIVKQYPELPHGCEITSLTAVIQYLGKKANKIDLAKNYLPKKELYTKNKKLYGADPMQYYVGSPWKKNGWFCYAPPIVNAANNYFSHHHMEYTAYDFSKKSEADFVSALKNNEQIIIWTTMRLENVQTIRKWYFESSHQQTLVPINLHCVVLRGIQKNKVFYMDPIYGNKVASMDLFFKRYRQLGSHAVVIKSNPVVTHKTISISNHSAFLIQSTDGYTKTLPDNPNYADMMVSLEYFAQNAQMQILREEQHPNRIKLYDAQHNVVFSIGENQLIHNETAYPTTHIQMEMDGEIYISLLDFAKRLDIEIVA